MAKMTLLEMTQNILSAMNSDEVNSITDTVESQQVAEEIRNTFYDLYTDRDIPELESLVTLEASGDADRPNTLVIPDNVERIKWIKYLDHRWGSSPEFRNVEYLDPEDFIRRIVEGGTSDFGEYLAVPLTDTSPIEYSINAARAPHFYTVFDNDNTLVFDSYDADYESNLTGSNSLAWGILKREFDLDDDFIAPIDAHLFPHFLAEAKSACFINIKEVANSKEEQRARRHLVRSQFRTFKTNGQRKGIFSGTDFSRKR
jgi:hypothetical protein